jgi:tetratricopeptide (TPR) repeat protein
VSILTDLRNACPPERVWDEIASGLLRGEDALVLLEHASRCENCAAALKSAVEIFAPEAGETSPETAPDKRPLRSYTWPMTIAATILIAVLGVGYFYWIRSPDPLKQLARAYTAYRTIELRLPGADFGELRLERGGPTRSLSDQPTELLESAGRISRELAKKPNDPHWLWAKGRLALLENRPDDAIQSLEAAIDWGSSSPDLLTDLAIAYQQKARGTRGATDLNHAVELLGRALQANPNHPAALFDRAVIEGELQETGPAIVDFERLLSVEPSGQWSEEARSRLAQLRAKKAAFFERRPGEDAQQFDEIALDAALESGLSGSSGELASLANRMRTDHHDPWLSDLLKSASEPSMRDVVAVLGRVTSIRLTVETGRYQQENAALDKISTGVLPPSIALWGAFEILYRATHLHGVFLCPASPDPLLAELLARQYHWLAAQALREEAYCKIQAGDIDGAEKDGQKSIAIAKLYAFPVAAIRSQAIPAYVEWRRGRYRQAIDLAGSALTAVHHRRLPVARSHEFHAILETVSEDLGWWNSAEIAAAAMSETARAAGFRDLQYSNMMRWAQLALQCGRPVVARKLFEQAMTYYESLAPSENQAWAEIGFAEATHDESRLLPFAARLEKSQDSVVWIPYQQVRSALALQQGRLADAQARLSRITAWLRAHEASHSNKSNQWHAELRAAGQLSVETLLRQGKFRPAFEALQQFRAAEWQPLSIAPASATRLPENAEQFSFVSLENRFGAWRLDGDAMEFRWIDVSRAEVVRLTRCLRRLVTSPDSRITDIGDLSARLRKTLFGTWLDGIALDRPLVIQTDEALIDLPFSLFPGKNEPLGLEHPISVTALALRPALPAAEKPSTNGNILLIDASELNPAWAQELPPLSSVKREIASIRAVAQSGAEIMEGGSLTPLALSSHAASARILHFAGHAVKTAAGVALMLPGSSTPTGVEDLKRLGFRPPPTVVLSGCSTGERIENESFGPGSLATAFLLEGSAEVIASLWSVNSESTADFMAEFYRHLSSEGSPAALQAAMRLLQRSGRYSHPYYWATFTRFIRA